MSFLEELEKRQISHQKYKKSVLDEMNSIREHIIKRTIELESCSRRDISNIFILNQDHENLYDKYLALSFAIDYHENQHIKADASEIAKIYLKNIENPPKSLEKYLIDYIGNPDKVYPSFQGLYSPSNNSWIYKRIPYSFLPKRSEKLWPINPLILHLQKISQNPEYFDALMRHEYTHRVLDEGVPNLAELKREKPYTRAIDEAAAQAVSISMVGKKLNSDYYRENKSYNRSLLETCTKAFLERVEGESNPVEAIRKTAIEALVQIEEGHSGHPAELILGRDLGESLKREKNLRAEIERIEYYFQDSLQILGLSENERQLWEQERGRTGENILEMTEFLQGETKELGKLIKNRYSDEHKYFQIVRDLESELERLESFYKKETEEKDQIKKLVKELEAAKEQLNKNLSSKEPSLHQEHFKTIFETSEKIADNSEPIAEKILEILDEAMKEVEALKNTELFKGRDLGELEDPEHIIYILEGFIKEVRSDLENFIEDYQRIQELTERSEEDLDRLEELGN